MERNKFNKLLGRYLKGDANETENAMVEAWYKSYHAEEEHILVDPLAKENAKQKLRAAIEQQNPQVKTAKLYGNPIRIAASVLLLSTVGLLLYTLTKRQNVPETAQYTIIQTGVGALKKVALPDSSEVWLNTASRIRIPKKFHGNTREVFLEEGEAFFEVRKNPERPFIVHASALNIQVLGTSFNVRSYHSISRQKVLVKTGKVRVSHGKDLLGTLIPGDQLTYDKATLKTQLSHSRSDRSAGWKDGSIYLEQASFEELAMVLQNTYGLQLKAGSSRVRSYQFTLLLSTSQPIDKTLSMISMIHNTHYRKEAGDIIIY